MRNRKGNHQTMKSWKTQLRIVGLIALLNVVPFVRGCGDLEGLHETAGFPVTYFSFSSSTFDLSTVHATTLGVNIAVLYVVICLVLIRWRDIGTIVVSWRFLVSLLVATVLLKLCNVYLFVALVPFCIIIAGFFPDLSEVTIIDSLARVVFLSVLVVCYRIARDQERRKSESVAHSPLEGHVGESLGDG